MDFLEWAKFYSFSSSWNYHFVKFTDEYSIFNGQFDTRITQYNNLQWIALRLTNFYSIFKSDTWIHTVACSATLFYSAIKWNIHQVIEGMGRFARLLPSIWNSEWIWEIFECIIFVADFPDWFEWCFSSIRTCEELRTRLLCSLFVELVRWSERYFHWDFS